MNPAPAETVAALAAAAATAALLPLARRRSWIDRREGEEHRKPRRQAVPAVGGLALFASLLVWLWLTGGGLPGAAGRGGSGLLGLGAALGVGLVDDLRPGGLRAGPKVAAQLVAGLVLGFEVGSSPLEALTLALWVVVACNALNTFDNADGALLGQSLAFGVSHPPLAAAAAGVLPFNLLLRRGPERVPLAYLGDSGSHLLGAWVALVPAARWMLVLPLLDLARLAVLRRREGRAPWTGDRRHLAHRLAARGLGEPAVVLVLLLVAAPTLLAAHALGGAMQWALGLLGGAATFLVALLLAPDEPAGAREAGTGPK